jgi:hypothetical protein
MNAKSHRKIASQASNFLSGHYAGAITANTAMVSKFPLDARGDAV